MQLLIVKPDAEEDILESFAWYESRKDNLGAAFVEKVGLTFKKIQKRPEPYEIRYRQVRIAFSLWSAL